MIGIAQAQLSAPSIAGSTSAGSTEITDGAYRVGGLVGANSATSQYSLSADIVNLWRPSDRTMRYVVGTSAVINDIGTTGLNGRDQAAAFTANNWLHLYLVGPNTVTSSSLATRSSLVAPPTGPTLPTSETHWAYAGAVRLSGSTQIYPTIMTGNRAYYANTSTSIRVLSSGTSTAFIAVDASAFVPPNSRLMLSRVVGLAAFPSFIMVRPTGSTSPDGYTAAGGNSGQEECVLDVLLNSSQSFDYMVNAVGATAVIDVYGYKMPNGDV